VKRVRGDRSSGPLPEPDPRPTRASSNAVVPDLFDPPVLDRNRR